MTLDIPISTEGEIRTFFLDLRVQIRRPSVEIGDVDKGAAAAAATGTTSKNIVGHVKILDGSPRYA